MPGLFSPSEPRTSRQERNLDFLNLQKILGNYFPKFDAVKVIRKAYPNVVPSRVLPQDERSLRRNDHGRPLDAPGTARAINGLPSGLGRLEELARLCERASLPLSWDGESSKPVEAYAEFLN
jgi:hypothetical protein